MPHITAIVPNYNHAAFLDRRMQSILAQTYGQLEIIILDDASTDNSKQVIEKYWNHPLVSKVVYNEANTGSPIAQWMRGISLAETDWIWIAESDDTCHPHFLKSLAPGLENPDCVLASSEVVFINEQDDVILRFPSIGERLVQGGQFVHEHMLKACYLCNSGMAVFRKSAAPLPGPWMEQLTYSPDYYFWTKLMLAGMVYTSGEAHACFRKHAREFTHGKYGSLADHRDHALMLKLLFEENGIEKSALQEVIESKLIGLYTQRKGMNQAMFESYIEIWFQLAADTRVATHKPGLEAKAFVRKLRHRLGMPYK